MEEYACQEHKTFDWPCPVCETEPQRDLDAALADLRSYCPDDPESVDIEATGGSLEGMLAEFARAYDRVHKEGE